MLRAVTTEQYVKAKEWSREFTSDVDNARVNPKWIGQSSRFWYQRDVRIGTVKGTEFVVVNPVRDTVVPAFNHERLAASLTIALEETIDAHQLPIQELRIQEDDDVIHFFAKDKYWACELEEYTLCEAEPPPKAAEHEWLSPDGRWAAYVQNYNLYVRHLFTKEVVQLTHDGERYYGYASEEEAMSDTTKRIFGGPSTPPSVVWSPDSKKLITMRLDEREVLDLHIVQNVPLDREKVRPILYSSRFALVGDTHVPKMEVYICDIEDQQAFRVNTDAVEVSSPSPFVYALPLAGWTADSQQVYYMTISRDFKTAQLTLVEADSGETRVIAEDKSDTFIFTHLYHNGYMQLYLGLLPSLNPNFKLLQDESLLWLSERDGYGHLYVIDACTGETLRPLTTGNWNVRRLIAIDEEQGWVYFTASGREAERDPYYQHLYRIQLDGSCLTLLTPEDANHIVLLSPDLSYIVNTYSRVDLAPVTVLRHINGECIRDLEHANIQPLLDKGYQLPERFTVKAEDGVTDLYGVLFKPVNFDPTQKYPIIDYCYSGPQVVHTPKSFILSCSVSGGAESLAQLGFFTIMMDGMGTPFRSRAFIEAVSGNMGDGCGLGDHVAALPQLAQLYPSINTERVGIWGSSGGGYGSARAILKYPDTYKAAVSSAGNHDQLMYIWSWGEHYQGQLDPQHPDRYANQANADLAANLKGKLLLAHGDVDDNVHIGQTLRLADALIKANKDFDLLIMPNVGHGIGSEAYFLRRKWDYFVKHLLGVEPPELPAEADAKTIEVVMN